MQQSIGQTCGTHSICLQLQSTQCTRHLQTSQQLRCCCLLPWSPCTLHAFTPHGSLEAEPTCPAGPEGCSWRAWQRPHLHRWQGLQGPPQVHALRWIPSGLPLAPTGAAAAWLPQLLHGHACWTEQQRSWRRGLQHKLKPLEKMRWGCNTCMTTGSHSLNECAYKTEQGNHPTEQGGHGGIDMPHRLHKQQHTTTAQYCS